MRTWCWSLAICGILYPTHTEHRHVLHYIVTLFPQCHCTPLVSLQMDANDNKGTAPHPINGLHHRLPPPFPCDKGTTNGGWQICSARFL